MNRNASEEPMDDWNDLPPVLLDADLCRVLRMKPRTLKRRREHKAFPIRELPALDRKHRYSRSDVIAFLERQRRA